MGGSETFSRITVEVFVIKDEILPAGIIGIPGIIPMTGAGPGAIR